MRFDSRLLGSIPIFSAQTHASVPLGTLATFEPTETRAELLRENQQQLITATSDLGDGVSLGAVMSDVRAILAENPPPAGIRVELGGQYAGQQAAFRALLLVLALAGASVIAVMVIQFQSFIEPLVVLLAAPLSFVGAMLLLLVTGTPLNVSSFMGLILLVGLIVKNGIILLDFTKHLMKEAGLAAGAGTPRGGAHSSAADPHDDAVHALRAAAARAGNRGGERLAAPARARGHRRARSLDADHVVRRAESIGGDPRARVRGSWRSLCGGGAYGGANRVDLAGIRELLRLGWHQQFHAKTHGGSCAKIPTVIY